MSDSPIWCRGNCSFSKRTTLRPSRARRLATVLPAGPPPITITSNSLVFISAGISGISNRSQFWFKELREETVHLQQTPAFECYSSVAALEHVLPLEPLIYGLKLLPHIDVEFRAEILGIDRSRLELQNHFADQHLLRSQRQCSQ